MQINIQEEIPCPRVKSLCFHRERPVILLALHNGEIRAYDYSLSTFIDTFLDHDGPVRSIDFHSTNDLFLSGGDDQFVRVWDYTNKTNFKLKGHTDYIRCVKFHPFEPFILSTSDDRTIKIWNFQNQKKIKTLAGHTNYVMCANFLNNQKIVSVSLDQTIRIWNIEDGTSEIIEGHDKGINTLTISYPINGQIRTDLQNRNDFIILTGADDKNIKMFDSDFLVKDSFSYHNKPVTAVIYYDKSVISCGEDGFIFINKNKQIKRIEREGRFWCLAHNEKDVLAAGHDSSFVIFKLKKDVIFDSRFYIKENSILNYKNERIIDLKKEAHSILSNETHLIVNYPHKFEIYSLKKSDKISKFGNSKGPIWSEMGCALFFNNQIISVNNSEYNSFTFDGKILEENIFSNDGIATGTSDYIFIHHFKKLTIVDKGYRKNTVNLPFNIEQITYQNKILVVIGKNDLVMMTNDFQSQNTVQNGTKEWRIVRHVKEMVRIFSAVIENDVIFYTTEKQLKYLFKESNGIICTVNSMFIVKKYQQNGKEICLFVSNKEILEREVNLDEIMFKKAVLNNDKKIIDNFIGRLPGLSLINFLKENGRGEIALPYIENQKEKFLLYLSMNDFEKAYECAKSKYEFSQIVNKAFATLKTSGTDLIEKYFQIIESAIKQTENDQKLFLFYLCTKKYDKIKDAQFTDLNIKIFQAVFNHDRDTAIQILSDHNNLTDNTALISKNPTDELSDFECFADEQLAEDSVKKPENFEHQSLKKDHQRENKNEQKGTDSKTLEKQEYESSQIYDQELLSKKSGFITADCDFETEFDEALDNFDNHKVKDARRQLFSILYSLKDNLEEENRFLIGSYLAGIDSEKKRKKETDIERILDRVQFFFNLKLTKKHRNMQTETFVAINYKNGNFDIAKTVASSFIQESESNKNESFQRVLDSAKIGNAFEQKTGLFCVDSGNYETSAFVCQFCGNANEKDKCYICEVGRLVKK
ncbi:Vesicle coat complex COPI, alpha subunit [Pseudoloma neurophilia]|uniref:Vesicle coat complex COPI, alpha subunit n=1 Tax=Pseudoloma neurophilia TaxID=146866 RepID=A0A0R0M1E9_9MICR|nr:Vesicle coat complex COPI, alpha subunit [Pseudoloma neurophilia]